MRLNRSASRGLRRFSFPFDGPGARAQALVHAPAEGAGAGCSSPTTRSMPRDRSTPLLHRAGIGDAFRRLGDRLARRGVVADLYVFGGLRGPRPRLATTHHTLTDRPALTAASGEAAVTVADLGSAAAG